MKFDKPSVANGSSVEGDIKMAKARMTYQDSADYAAWRLRMTLLPPAAPPRGADPDPHGDAVRFHMARLDPEAKPNPIMRARIAAEFRKFGVSLASIPDDRKIRPAEHYVMPDSSVPIGASDALRALNMRREQAEKSLPF